ncbi:MAG: hypothetical protein ACF8PN_07975 [Phycisphaerales bacterium]
MINWFRRLLRAVEGIAVTLGGLCDAVHALDTGAARDGALDGRVAALERELERRHAEAEGLLLKAAGKFDAARAAEERARRLAERVETSEDDQLDALRSAYAEAGIPLDDEGSGEGEGLHAVRNGMATRDESRANAYAMKWARR